MLKESFLGIILLQFLSGSVSQTPQLLLEYVNHPDETCIIEKNAFEFKGHVDTSGIIMDDWQDILRFERKTPSLLWFPICSVNIKTAVCGIESLPCYCSQQNGTVYSFTIKPSAEIIYSENDARLAWTKNDYSLTASNSIPQTIPHIYAKLIKNASMIDSANGIKTVDIENCIMTASKEDGQVFQYCASNLQNHTLKINYGSFESLSTTDCVNYTFNPGTIKSDDIFYVSHVESSDCKRSKTYNCTIIEELTTESGLTKEQKLGLGLGLGLGLLFLLILIFLIVWIRCPIGFCKTVCKRQSKELIAETGMQLDSKNKKNQQTKNNLTPRLENSQESPAH